jgi:hypothetical protein
LAGYVTSTRRSPNTPRYPFDVTSFGSRLQGPDFLGVYANSVVGTQTTTSWRTNSGVVDDELANLDSATNQLQAVRSIARDTRDYTTSYDRGHTFSTVQNWTEVSHPDFVFNNLNGNKHRGPLMQNPTFLTYQPVMPSLPLFEGTDFYGATAIRNTIPTNPLTSLATSLGELYKDGLPRLPGFAGLAAGGLSSAKNLADNYLNYQFGWKPTVAATADGMTAVDASLSIIQQFLRDNGKTIRRSMSFPSETLDSRYRSGSGSVFDPSQSFSGAYISSGTVSETLLIRRSVYFKGGYTYHIPIPTGYLDKMEYYAALARRASGLEITPEVLWNLAPWSWFGDWLSNIGTIISNVSAFSNDGLVLRYGYLMVKTEGIHTVTTRGFQLAGMPSPITFSQVHRSVRKERIKATPYGFGLNPNSFTGSQWSILGALGISRSPGTLRN